ncbi:hypothetical protein Trydic_g2995 [Trypoxylus dichotomus]
MADSMQSEERHPLLFLFLDDANKNARKNRNVFFERGRSQGVMSGATAVLTQWPGHLSSCGLAMVVVVLTVLFFFLMLLASAVKPPINSFHPRCFRRSYDDIDTNLFLVHDDSVWQRDELDTLERIAMKYRQCDIELLILRKENSTCLKERINRKPKRQLVRPKRQTREMRKFVHPQNRSGEKINLNINVGARNLLKAFLERRRHLNITSSQVINSTTSIPYLPNVNDVLAKFPGITVKNMTETDFFSATPLYNIWKNLNKETLNFAARVLKLWENGGITFEIPHTEGNDSTTGDYQYETLEENSTTFSTSTVGTTKIIQRNISSKKPNKILKNMIDIGYTSFRNLPEGLVTVDEEGIHMETKTTCHAFFGEALVQLKSANNITTVPELIKNTLKTFCVRGAVDSEYCSSINSK